MTKGLHKGSLRKVDNPHQWMIDDARMELIQQIKAEVERLRKCVIQCQKDLGDYTDYMKGEEDAYDDILGFLSTLQEQPVCEDVEKELERFLVEDVDACVEDDTDKVRIFDVDTGKGDIDITYTDLKAIARHFAQWGAEHRGSSEIPKDQDIVEASEKYAGELYGYELKSNEDLQKVIACICGFKAGAKWQKEQMMKDALHGWLDEDNEPPYDLNVLCEEKIPFGKFKHCDKVKIIIVKED